MVAVPASLLGSLGRMRHKTTCNQPRAGAERLWVISLMAAIASIYRHHVLHEQSALSTYSVLAPCPDIVLVLIRLLYGTYIQLVCMYVCIVYIGFVRNVRLILKGIFFFSSQLRSIWIHNDLLTMFNIWIFVKILNCSFV